MKDNRLSKESEKKKRGRLSASSHENKKKRRGFTVVEAVIAMAIITAVSMTTVSVATRSLNSTIKSEQLTAVINMASSAVECFKFADDAESFGQALSAYNPRIREGDGHGGYYFDNGIYRVEFSVSYPGDALSDEQYATISIVAYYLEGTVGIYDTHYRKGS